MKTPSHFFHVAGCRLAAGLAVIISLLSVIHAKAQPVVLSDYPTNEAENVPVATSVVFVFNETINITNSGAVFFNESAKGSPISMTEIWSASNTVLTCSPQPIFPPDSAILWVLDVHDTNGQVLSSGYEGFFVTGPGEIIGTGSGTNAYTIFDISSVQFYDQNSASTPVPDPIEPYEFLALLVLASNRTATSATITLPSGSVSNLTQSALTPEDFSFGNSETNQTIFDDLFGNGDYVFNVVAPASNQTVTINLPASLPQPAVPQLANFPATQSVDSTQPFTLQWNAFPDATAQSSIYVTVSRAFTTAPLGDPNVLPGTATSVQIPAGTLQPDTTYPATVGFFNAIITTNTASDSASAAIRESVTQFTLTTSGGASSPPVLSNLSLGKTSFGFDINASANLTLIIQYNTNLSAASNSWQTLFATNGGPGAIQVTIPVNPTNQSIFYRAEVVQ